MNNREVVATSTLNQIRFMQKQQRKRIIKYLGLFFTFLKIFHTGTKWMHLQHEYIVMEQYSICTVEHFQLLFLINKHYLHLHRKSAFTLF